MAIDDERNDGATFPSPQGRLLPWIGEDGKPCYLSPRSGGGFLSRLADAVEAEQVRDSREVLAHSSGLLERASRAQELRFIAARLAECLATTLRVTESRGLRLGVIEPDGDEDVTESRGPGPAV
ncbi:hypothetical protein [Streptomyces sp. SID2888]|uniref:hypothetical protein n=1 Tax=Streptomyces TaxID=1883 RepID=UPI00136F3A3C|nr:hypothetical protein [Streptomyces sp. SID2888]MYV45765.1 hypothetical protein [Streptomyces sp. SID2888]